MQHPASHFLWTRFLWSSSILFGRKCAFSRYQSEIQITDLTDWLQRKFCFSSSLHPQARRSDPNSWRIMSWKLKELESGGRRTARLQSKYIMGQVDSVDSDTPSTGVKRCSVFPVHGAGLTHSVLYTHFSDIYSRDTRWRALPSGMFATREWSPRNIFGSFERGRHSPYRHYPFHLLFKLLVLLLSLSMSVLLLTLLSIVYQK